MKVLVGILCLISLAACGRKPGPVGPAGIQGERGEAGADGANGLDASLPPYAVVSIEDPCGDAPGIIDEVLLKLANGQFLVSFSENVSGKNTRFAILPPATYVTTDGSGCTFTITSDGQVL